MTLAQFEKELHVQFDEKKQKSRSYSIRAMAKEVGLPHSTLQKVLNGERRLGLRVARDLATHFGVTLEASEKSRRRPPGSKFKFRPLDPHSPAKVSWINLAILELMKLEDFEPTSHWIGDRLGLSSHVVDDLLSEMERNQMIDRSSATWTDLLEESAVHAERLLTTEVVRTALKTIIAVSGQAVDDIPYERREHSFGLFPVSLKDLPRLKKKLVELRWEFMTYAQNQKSAKDSIYALQLGFFPVTKEKK